MKWWRRDRAPSEATRAREQAEAALARTRSETHTYRAIGDSLRDLREKNHFAEAIAATFRGEAR